MIENYSILTLLVIIPSEKDLCKLLERPSNCQGNEENGLSDIPWRPLASPGSLSTTMDVHIHPDRGSATQGSVYRPSVTEKWQQENLVP